MLLISMAIGALKEKIRGVISGPQNLVGLDIGSHSIKAVWLSFSDKTCKLRAWGHSPIIVKPDAAPEERKFEIAAAIRATLSKSGITNKFVATSICGNSVIVRYVKVPRMTKSELPVMLPTEAEPFIPFDIKEVNLGAHILGDVVDEGQKKMEIVLVAAKKDVINSKIEIVSSAGYTPLLIDIDAFALETLNERLGNTKEGPAVLILNIGHKVTNLTIVEKGVTRVARDILIAGNAFTKAVAKGMELELDKAEDLKRKWGLQLTATPEITPAGDAAEESKVSGILYEVLKDLVGEVRRSVDFYFSQGADRSIGKVLLTGGSANMNNLAAFMSSELKVPVSVLDPMSILTDASSKGVPKNIAPALSVATGLALRKLWDWE